MDVVSLWIKEFSHGLFVPVRIVAVLPSKVVLFGRGTGILDWI
jgi:hypothetical protein